MRFAAAIRFASRRTRRPHRKVPTEAAVRTKSIAAFAPRLKTGAALLPLALLGACSFAPAYKPAQTATPPAFKEASLPMPAGWSEATPMDTSLRGDWWRAFNDPVLNDLETRALAASPTLAAALARYDEARANAREAAASLYPTIGVDANITHERTSANA